MAKVDALPASTLHILDSLPNQSHLRIRSIIQHGTIGHGSFGVIKSGVDMFTGDPLLAIETLNYQRRSAAAIKQELEIASLFSSDCIGIVSMLDSWCEPGESPPCQPSRQSDPAPEDVYVSILCRSSCTTSLHYRGLSIQLRGSACRWSTIPWSASTLESCSTLIKDLYLRRRSERSQELKTRRVWVEGGQMLATEI